MQPGFNGFSPEGLRFLSQVRQQNSKEWFDANRAVYDDRLVAPFRALVTELAPAMLMIDDLFETRPAIGKTLSRIHRDTRFSHDKTRYRSNLWLTFKRHSKDWTDAPAYFFELYPDGWRFGLGYYAASRDTMELFRQSMLQDTPRFLKMAACLGDTFELSGERYKRPKIKDQAPELARWYNFKSFAALADRSDLGTVFDGELVDVLARGFHQLAPLYHYLMEIDALKRELDRQRFDF